MNTPKRKAGIVVATPARTVCDDYARYFESTGDLRFIALGTRRGIDGVSKKNTRLKPSIGLFTYIAAKLVDPFKSESFRFGLLPWFDRWVCKQLQPGDHIISSYGYTNECFKFVQKHGGKTFVDAGNSHIENYWEIISEEHKIWNCPTPPFAYHWYERSKAMLESTDYILSPSNYVTQSFLSKGFKQNQILPIVYPLNLELFNPKYNARPKDRPLTLINTASLSLRKGTPYLLEALRVISKQNPEVRILLTNNVQDDIKPILSKYSDLKIEWAPGLSHDKLAERLNSADIFILPSLEDGLGRTVCEAIACGLQIITTSNTGACDFIEPGVNGEIVPIRNTDAIVEAVYKCANRMHEPPGNLQKMKELLSYSNLNNILHNHFDNLFKE